MATPRPDALTQVTRLLASTDKTRAQLEAALGRRGYAQEEVDQALRRASSLGYLDDGRVAQRKARADLEAGWAGEPLLARLLATGLEEATGRKAIKAAIAEAGWSPLTAARALVATRKLGGAKAARFLASRGFEEDVVERVIGTGGFER